MSALRKQSMSLYDYLTLDGHSDIRYEYIAGEVYAMAGASEPHNTVSGNIIGILHRQKRKGYRIYPSDMRVKTPTKLYAYPDIIVVCGQPEIVNERGQDTLLNPILIIEVLSPTTETFDRSDKSWHYRSIPSLQEYVLVAQDKARIERFLRHSDGQWLHMIADGLDASLPLQSVGASLPLSEVYDEVMLPNRDPEE
jgi:Uma2 family endonuclease